MCVVDILRCSSLFRGVTKNVFFSVRLTLSVDPPPPLTVIFSKPDSKKTVFFMTPYAAKVFPKEDNTSTQLGARQISAQ